jgi:hypothetical protein
MKQFFRALLAAALVLVVGPARAAPAQPEIESDLVRAGVAAYDELDFPRCVAELTKALDEALTREEKLVTYKTLGFCHVALQRSDEAQADFERLLRIDETFELDHRVSPRIRAPFEKARAAVATGQGMSAGAGQATLPLARPSVAPALAKEGQAITVSLAYPGGVAEKVQLFYRTRGQALYSRAVGEGKSGQFVVTVPGIYVRAPALEYYLVLLDDTGAAVSRAGSLAQPLAVDVRAPKKPLYAKGWFWGVLGGVAAAGAIVAAVVATTTGGGVSKNAPASVTIQPQAQ